MNYMRTTLDLPEDLVNEAKAVLGFKSKTDTIVFALTELVRRHKRRKLAELFGSVSVEVDLDKSRRRPGSRSAL
jgi:Arc/MetJ family transcription regulator